MNIEHDNVLRFVKLTQNAKTPSRATPYSAGLDLFAAYDCLIPAGGKGLVFTDLAINLPFGTYGRIAPRSGLTWVHSLDVGAGGKCNFYYFFLFINEVL
jgi:dUTP pyrophosphatase